ncbi:MAG: hypothetical protein R2861_13090 [Desulfobacterales bacterium]
MAANVFSIVHRYRETETAYENIPEKVEQAVDFLKVRMENPRCWASSPALVWEIAWHPFAQKRSLNTKIPNTPSPLWKAMRRPSDHRDH